jgi:hypothetical protein
MEAQKNWHDSIIMNLNLQRWQDTLQTVYQRAAVDAMFRAKCLADARGVIKEVSGVEMPPTARFRFVEQIEEAVFVLPPKQTRGELDDAELAGVAGGYATFGFSTSNCAPFVTC